MKNSFLYQLFQSDRRLFYCLLPLLVLHLLCNLSGFQITPFFVWGMYSEQEKQVNHHPSFVIQHPSGKLECSAGFSDNTRFVMQTPFTFAEAWLANQNPQTIWWQTHGPTFYAKLTERKPSLLHSPQTWHQFTDWHARYIESRTGLSRPFTVQILYLQWKAGAILPTATPSILWHVE